MVWLRGQIDNDEEGNRQWVQIVGWVNARPPDRTAAVASLSAPQASRGVSPHRAAVQAAVGSTGRAFLAFEGASTRRR